MRRWMLFGFVIALVAAGIGYYLINRDHRVDIVHTAVDYEMDASVLFQTYQENEAESDRRYLGKTLLVEGQISSIDIASNDMSIALASGADMGQVVCELNPDLAGDDREWKIGDQITIKGECSGMLMDVILSNAIIIVK